MKLYPFLPFTIKKAKREGKRFKGLGAQVAPFFPYQKLEMEQAELDFDVNSYLGLALVTAAGFGLAMSIVMLLLWVRIQVVELLVGAPLVGLFISFFVFQSIRLNPRISVKAKVRNIDRNLVFALRAMLIQIRSGIPLFDSLNSLANGKFGKVSDAFRDAVDKIGSGEPDEDALQEVATNNPSSFFRRALWQLVTGLKGGGDIGLILSEIVATMTQAEKIQIRQYGSSLQVLTLVYMLLAVIMPSLGVTFLIVLSSFPQVNVTETMFWGFLGLLLMAQVMYLGVLKLKRPAIMGGGD